MMHAFSDSNLGLARFAFGTRTSPKMSPRRWRSRICCREGSRLSSASLWGGQPFLSGFQVESRANCVQIIYIYIESKIELHPGCPLLRKTSYLVEVQLARANHTASHPCSSISQLPFFVLEFIGALRRMRATLFQRDAPRKSPPFAPLARLAIR